MTPRYDDASEVEEDEKAKLDKEREEQRQKEHDERLKQDEAERKRQQEEDRKKQKERDKALDDKDKAPAKSNNNQPNKGTPVNNNTPNPPSDFIPPKRKKDEEEETTEDTESVEDKRRKRKEERARKKAERDRNFKEGKGNYTDEQLAKQKERQAKRDARSAKYAEQDAEFDSKVKSFWNGVDEKAAMHKRMREAKRYAEENFSEVTEVASNGLVEGLLDSVPILGDYRKIKRGLSTFRGPKERGKSSQERANRETEEMLAMMEEAPEQSDSVEGSFESGGIIINAGSGGKLTASFTKDNKMKDWEKGFGLFDTKGHWANLKKAALSSKAVSSEGYILRNRPIDISEFKYQLSSRIVDKLYENQPRKRELYYANIRKAEEEEKRKAEEAEKAKVEAYLNGRGYLGQSESDYLGGTDANTNFFCFATANYNSAARVHSDINGQLPTKGKSLEIIEHIAKNEIGVNNETEYNEDGTVFKARGYVLDDVAILDEASKQLGDNTKWTLVNSYKSYEQYKADFDVLNKKDKKTATVFNFKTGLGNGVHYCMKLSDTTIIVTDETTEKEVKKSAFNFIDSWDGAENKRSVYDKEKENADGTKGGWISIKGPIAVEDVNIIRLYKENEGDVK